MLGKLHSAKYKRKPRSGSKKCEELPTLAPVNLKCFYQPKSAT
jgi:hypothetical protein